MGLITPLKSINQARLLNAVGTIQGANNPARNTRLKRKLRFGNRAKPRPNRSLKGTVKTL